MHRVCALELTDRSRLISLILAVLVAVPLLTAVPSPAEAQDPVEEVETLCVYRGEKVFWGGTTTACKNSDEIVELPGDYPLTFCVAIGLKIEMALPDGSCADQKLSPLTIPDEGPMVMCARNRRNGRINTDRAEVTYELSPLDCQPPQYVTPYITPAPPTAVDDTFTTDEDTPLIVPAGGVLENDTDYNPGTVQVHQLTQPVIGTVTLNADGSLSYDPSGLFDHLDDDESQDITFTYNISDGELVSNNATVTLTITGVNDAPVANADAYTTDEDTSLFIVAPGVLGNDTDAEGHTLTAHLQDAPSAGVVNLGEDGSVAYDPAGVFEHLAAGQTAPVQFTYVARDGSADSGLTTVGITITGVNDAPVAADDSFTVDENTILPITPAELLGNDSDVDSPASSLAVTDVIHGNPPAAFSTAADGTITFDPRTAYDDLSDGMSATATIQYRASDGDALSAPAMIRITVTGLSTPAAADDSDETDQNTPIEIDILANDDVTAAGATFEAVPTATTQGLFTFDDITGLLTYDPNGQFDDLGPGQSALDRFRYRLVNAEGASRTALITVIVQGRNDAPTVQSAYGPKRVTASGVTTVAAPGVLTGIFDPDPVDEPSGTVTAQLIAPPEWGRLTLAANGGFSYDPAGELTDTSPPVTFRFRATDGGGESVTQTVTLDLNATDPPAFVVTTLQQTFYLGDVAVGTVQATGASPVTYSAAPSEFFIIDPITGDISMVGDGQQLALEDHFLDVTATDEGGLATTARVTIDVRVRFNPTPETFNVVGNVPAQGGASPPAVDGDMVVTFGDGLLDNDGPRDGSIDLVDAGLKDTSLGGYVEILSSGDFTYRPPRPGGTSGAADCDLSPSSWDGSVPAVDTFTYQIQDTTNPSAPSETLTVTLNLDDVVWVVDASASGPGCGTAERPFSALSSITDSSDDVAGHAIYVRRAGGLVNADGVTLEDGQRLLGEGVALTLGGHSLRPAADPAVIGPEVNEVIRLASDNRLEGFIVDAEEDAIAAAASTNIGSAIIDLDSVSAMRTALDLQGGGNLQAQIDTLSGGTDGNPAADLLDIVGSLDVSQSGSGGVLLTSSSLAVGIATHTVDTAPTAGVQVVGGAPTVTIGSYTGDATQANVSLSQTAADVTITSLTSTGGAALSVSGGTADVTITSVTAQVNQGAGIGLTGAGGTITINGGAISRSGGAPVLVDSSGLVGQVVNRADLRLGVAADAPGSSSGRSLRATGGAGGSQLSQLGDVVDRGSGLSITSNNAAAVIRIAGDIDVATSGGSALTVTNSPVEAPGANNRLTSSDADVVSMNGPTIGAQGVQLADVQATGGGILLTDVDRIGAAELVVLAGNIADGRIRITDSTGIKLKGIAIDASETDTGSAAVVDISGTQSVELDGISIDGPTPLPGLRSTGDANLIVSGVSVDRTNAPGFEVRNPAGLVTLDRGTDTTLVAGTQLLIADDGSKASSATVAVNDVQLTAATASDNGVEIIADGAADLTVNGDGVSVYHAIVGLGAEAINGGRLTLGLQGVYAYGSKFSSPSPAADAVVRVHADGANSTIHFDMNDVDVQFPQRPDAEQENVFDFAHGFYAYATNGGRVGGGNSVIDTLRVVNASASGVHLEDIDTLTLHQVTVANPSLSAMNIINSKNIVVNTPQFSGNFHGPLVDSEDPSKGYWYAANAVYLLHSENVTIRGGSIELGKQVPDDNEAIFPYTMADPPTPAQFDGMTEALCDRVTETTIADQADTRQGQVGIFGRHLSGNITVDGVRVIGGDTAQVVLFNGNGVFKDDKLSFAPPRQAVKAVKFTIGITNIDVAPQHVGTIVGGHSSPMSVTPDVDVAFSPFTARGSGRTVVCASGLGVDVTGSPRYDTTAPPPVLTIAAAALASSESRINISGARLSYDNTGLTAAQRTAAEKKPALEIRGFSRGPTITDAQVTGAAGHGLAIPAANHLVRLTNVLINDVGQVGVLFAPGAKTGRRATLTNVRVDQAGSDGIRATNMAKLEIFSSSTQLAGPPVGEIGLKVNDINCLDAQNGNFQGVSTGIRLEGTVGLKGRSTVTEGSPPASRPETAEEWFTRLGNSYGALQGTGSAPNCT